MLKILTKTPRAIVFTTGLFTIGSFFNDLSYSYLAHNHSDMKPVNLQARYGGETYAVVSGATSATGQAFCDRLSKNGLKLILVDTEQSQLDELSKKHNGSVTIAFDFKSKDDWNDYEQLCNKISEAGEVSMLVNAVE